MTIQELVAEYPVHQKAARCWALMYIRAQQEEDSDRMAEFSKKAQEEAIKAVEIRRMVAWLKEYGLIE